MYLMALERQYEYPLPPLPPGMGGGVFGAGAGGAHLRVGLPGDRAPPAHARRDAPPLAVPSQLVQCV